MSLAIGSNTIKFVEKKGIKFFEGFNATIKNEKPVRVFFDGEMGETASIHVRDKKGNKLGFYDLKFNTPDKSSMEGVQLYADEPHENVGEVLSLAALIEFSKNNLNHFRLFSFKETLPFHARFGFILDNKNEDFILKALDYIKKSKVRYIDEIKYKASFFAPRIEQSEKYLKEDKYLLERGCKVISDYLKHLSRNKINKNVPPFENGSWVQFTDWEFETNRIFLNPLLEKHNIDYRF